MIEIFNNRKEAGQKLSILLGKYMARPGISVVTYTLSGIPIAGEVADALNSPMTLIFTGRITTKQSQEIEIGALAENEVSVIDDSVLHKEKISSELLDEAVNRAQGRLAEKMLEYRRRHLVIKNTVVILTSDAVRSAMRVQAAVLALKEYNPFQIILAVPLITDRDYEQLKGIVSDIKYLKKTASAEELLSVYETMPLFNYETAPGLLERNVKNNAK